MIALVTLVVLLLCNEVVQSFHFPASRFSCRIAKVRLEMSDADEPVVSSVPSELPVESTEADGIEETPEEKYKREKLAEIAERKAAEVFVTRDTGKYECQACGFVYKEAEGYPKRGVPPGTLFENIDKFRCPECGANKKYFVAETETLSGFKENLKYGLGANSLTGEQKGNLIYGGLAIFFALFLGGYLLE